MRVHHAPERVALPDELPRLITRKVEKTPERELVVDRKPGAPSAPAAQSQRHAVPVGADRHVGAAFVKLRPRSSPTVALRTR